MYTNLRLTQEWQAVFESAEADLGAPLRVLNGRGRANYEGSVASWDDTQADACGVDADHARAAGITIVMYGSGPRNDNVRWTNVENIPAEFSPTGRRRGADPHMYDMLLISPEQCEGLDPITLLTDPNLGCVWAEVYPQLICFPVNITTQYDPERLNLDVVLRELLNQASPGNIDQEALAAARAERNLARFSEWYRQQPERLLGQVRERIVATERDMGSYQRQVMTYMEQLRTMGREAEAIEMTIEAGPEHMVSEWEKLANHPRITRIEMRSNDTLRIVTDDILLTHPRDADYTALMGRFQIDTQMQSGHTSYLNLDSPRNGRSHPHVSEEGLPCYGEMHSAIAQTWQSGNLVAKFEYDLAFLESYNPNDDWGRYAHRWINDPFVREASVEAEAVAA